MTALRLLLETTRGGLMSKRWPYIGARLFHNIENGLGGSDPATLRRWYRQLDSMVRNSQNRKAGELRATVLRLASHNLRVKPVALSRIDPDRLGPIMAERFPAGPRAGDVPIVVLGGLHGAGPLSVVDGRHRVHAAISRGDTTIRAVSIQGSKRPHWTKWVPSEPKRRWMNPNEPP